MKTGKRRGGVAVLRRNTNPFVAVLRVKRLREGRRKDGRRTDKEDDGSRFVVFVACCVGENKRPQNKGKEGAKKTREGESGGLR